jgi:hypothetical protein
MTSLYVEDDYWGVGYAQTGVTVDWKNKIIFVPKTESLLIQSVPREIRQLDIDQFRLRLKDLEDDAEGMSFLDTHSHSPPVTVGGVTLARVVEIINGYTVTFEDGQYAINLVGANSNIADVTNVNQVSVRSANSAGLTDLSSLQSGSYNGGVSINTTSIYSGTFFPMGTRGFPVNNIADAVEIARLRGLKSIFVANDLYLTDGDFSDYKLTFIGNSVHIILYIGAGADVALCEFQNLTVSGIIDNGVVLRECVVNNVTIFNGTLFICAIIGSIYLDGNLQCTMLGCYSAQPIPIIIDYTNADTGMITVIRGWSGDVSIVNCGVATVSDVGLSTGEVHLDSTVTSGIFNIYESATIVNNSSAVINDRTIYKIAAERNWNIGVSEISSPGSVGEKIRKNLLR